MLYETLKLFSTVRDKEYKTKSLGELANTYNASQDLEIKNICFSEIFTRVSPIISKAINVFSTLDETDMVSRSMTALLYCLKNYKEGKRFETFSRYALYSTYRTMIKEQNRDKVKANHVAFSLDEAKENFNYEPLSEDDSNKASYDRLQELGKTFGFTDLEYEIYSAFLFGKIKSGREFILDKKAGNSPITYLKYNKAFNSMKDKIDMEKIKIN